MAPATVLNWFLMADETHGPAIKITKTIIAMIRTYSTVDCPFGRRVNLGDTPPPKGISAAFVCGSSRIGLAYAVEDRHDLAS